MNQDLIWQAIRYALMNAGASFVTKGVITGDQETTIVAGVVTALAVGWGLFVKWNTKSVTAVTGARADVPTVSPATGVVKP